LPFIEEVAGVAGVDGLVCVEPGCDIVIWSPPKLLDFKILSLFSNSSARSKEKSNQSLVGPPEDLLFVFHPKSRF